MANKMSFFRTITRNIGYKIGALFLAILLWLIVYNIDDPNKTRMYTLNVDITNTSYLEELNLCYEVLDDSNQVTFAINTARSNLDELTESDFKAVANLADMEISEDGKEALVPIVISASRHASEIKFTNNTKYLKIALEDLFSAKFAVKARTTGDVAEGFALAGVTVVNPTMITVEGPASVVQKIDTVVATVDISNISMDYTCDVKPVYYDVDGKEINVARIIDFSADKVTVTASVLATKTVPLNFSTVGTPAEGYQVTEIVSTPESVTIKGDATILNDITGIDLPSNLLNIQNATGNITSNIDVSQYLPNGVSLWKTDDSSVTVTVRIISAKTESYNVSTSNITILGLDSGYKAAISQNAINVRITGMEDDLSNITAESIIGTIDVSAYGVGSYSVPVKFDVDQELYQASTVNVTVVISKEDEASSEDEGDNSSETEGTNKNNNSNSNTNGNSVVSPSGQAEKSDEITN